MSLRTTSHCQHDFFTLHSTDIANRNRAQNSIMLRNAVPRDLVVDLPMEQKKRKRGRPARKLQPTRTRSPSPEPSNASAAADLDLPESLEQHRDSRSPLGSRPRQDSDPDKAPPTPVRSAHRSDTEDADKGSSSSEELKLEVKRRRMAEHTAVMDSMLTPRRPEQDTNVKGLVQREQWLMEMQPPPDDTLYKSQEIEFDDITWIFDSSVSLFTSPLIANVSPGSGGRRQ